MNSSDQQYEKEIGAGFKRGERWAFEAAAKLYFAPMVHFVSHLLRDRDKAIDLVQEAFLLACRAHHKFDGSRSLLPWLCQIARNLAYKEFHRRKKRPHVSWEDEMRNNHPTAPEDTTNPRLQMVDKEIRSKVHRAMDRIKPVYRDVLIMRMMQGLSSDTVAKMLDIPVSTVNTRTFRALEQLRRFVRMEGLSEEELFS